MRKLNYDPNKGVASIYHLVATSQKCVNKCPF